MFLGHGADANAENNSGMTPLHILSNSECKINDEGSVRNFALLLLKHGAAVNRRNKDTETPLHLAIRRDQFKLAGTLLEHGTDVNAENSEGKTPLRILSESRYYDEGDFINHAQSLLEHGVGVNRQDEDNKTSLLLGIGKGKCEFAQIFIERSADATLENNMGEISVQQVSPGHNGSQERGLGLVQQSLERGVDLNAQDENQMTRPRYLPSNLGPIQMATLLLYHGADPNAGKNGGEDPSCQEIEGEYYIQAHLCGYYTVFNISVML